MSNGKPRDLRKEQDWRRWIRQWQKSGLSVSAFCALHNLSQPSFYAWRREIEQRDAAAATFVPVQVVPSVPAATSRFEVVLTGGRKIRVPADFDSATLRQLLAVLEEAPAC